MAQNTQASARNTQVKEDANHAIVILTIQTTNHQSRTELLTHQMRYIHQVASYDVS